LAAVAFVTVIFTGVAFTTVVFTGMPLTAMARTGVGNEQVYQRSTANTEANSSC
jgi:hypothetical protein